MKMKDVIKTADVLIKFSEGREMPTKKLTKHINRAIIMLIKYAEVLDQRETNPISTNNDHVTFCNWVNSVKVPKDK
jgi:hypothetical protein